MRLDLADSLGGLGLLLLAVAIGVTWGWPGLLGYLGGVLLLVSVGMAMSRGRKAPK
jgi:uncharacterized membrane protein